MKKIILVLTMICLFTSLNAQYMNKGAQGVMGNLSGIGFESEVIDKNYNYNLDMDISYFLFVADLIEVNGGLGFNSFGRGGEVDESLSYSIGLRSYRPFGFFSGIGYEGFFLEDLSYYRHMFKFEVGIRHFLNEKIFLEPNFSYKLGLGNNDIPNRFGFAFGIGFNF